MHRTWSKGFVLILWAGLLAACTPAEPAINMVPLAPSPALEQVTKVATMVEAVQATPTRPPTATPVIPTLAPTSAANSTEPVGLDCESTFERRELKEPYQRNKANDPRFTLSGEELLATFARMGIKRMCIPKPLGAPFINADWDSANAENAKIMKGTMISLGFEGLYRGGGWSSGFVIAATYDFAAPTEYDTFATPEDYDTLRKGMMPNRAAGKFVSAGGMAGFKRVAAGIGMGLTPLYMTYVIPFEKGYLAVVYSLGNFEGDLQPVMDKISRGAYPQGLADQIALFGAMAESVEK